MDRSTALFLAAACFDDGRFLEQLSGRIACRTESQDPAQAGTLQDYLGDKLLPPLRKLGFTGRILANPVPGGSPFLIATRTEADAPITVLSYGHGDVVRGAAAQWSTGRDPWQLKVEGDRWYGRGTADNKGQHTINLLALEQVIAARRGRLGFNVTLLMEMGEEIGSPGLRELCEQQREALRADLFLASDGPRLSALQPTVFLGSRGGVNFDLCVDLRAQGAHSGNWGGLLRNPGIRLAHALASLVDARGRILVPGLRPPPVPPSVRDALATVTVGGGAGEPEIDSDWGEADLTPAERVYAWNTLEVLAFKTGNPEAPVNAIPPRAMAHCQIRHVVGSDSTRFLEHLRAHLDAQGFHDVQVRANGPRMEATRLDPQDPWVQWALGSIRHSTAKAPALLPNLGGTLPNDVFADVLGLPTLWVPHSYPACAQHAPDEHLLGSLSREALQIMAGLFWDLGDQGAAVAARRNAGTPMEKPC